MPNPSQDDHFMTAALRLAAKAEAIGEVPVGAVVVWRGQVIGRGYNQVETRQDASRHAELIALRQASRKLKTWRLSACELYVTLEPCAMCAGASVWFRIRRIIYGARDPKAGACGSILTVAGHPRLNHCPGLTAGVLANDSRDLLQSFFGTLRHRKG